MISELAQEECSAALERVVDDFLAAADWHAPPVDTFELARRADMAVALDTRLIGRARTVRLTAGGSPQASILLRPEPRAERRQWAVAHEIGEQLAHRVFADWGVSPEEADPRLREQVANLLASRLLLPRGWFGADVRACDWDLAALKRRYATASHELIARRMLDLPAAAIVTLFDQGRITWRRSNLPGRAPPLAEAERRAWQAAHHEATASDERIEGMRIQAWPVHEPDWRREIVRCECREE